MIKEIFSRRLDGLLSMNGTGRCPEAFFNHFPFLFALEERKLNGDVDKEKNLYQEYKFRLIGSRIKMEK
jgi:hypothetical protein